MDCLYLRKKALLLDVFVVFILHVNTDAQGRASQCPVFKVPRGAVHKVCTNKHFKISCNLKICRGQTNNITWTKETLKEWIPVSGGQMSSSQIYSASDLLTSYLTFTNISENHDGLYRCELLLSNSSTVSHYINISVSVSSTNDSLADEMTCPEKGDNSETENPDTSFNSNPWWLPYLFICMGVVIPILILMLIFILCINGCTTLRRRKTHEKAHVQYTASVLSSPSPRVLKNGKFVGVQYSEQRHQHSHDSNTCSLTSPSAQSTSHVSDCGGDDSLSNRRDNSSSQVVYASLHHLTPSSSSTSPRPTREDFSEYASIRVS